MDRFRLRAVLERPVCILKLGSKLLKCILLGDKQLYKTLPL